MSNPLDRYRKPAEGKAEHAGGEDETGYVAYQHQKGKGRRLRIRLRKDAATAPSYDHLIDVLSDRTQGKEISLVFTHAYVAIKGRNLQELADMLAAELIDWIEEFDPKRWDKPDGAAPVIDSIEYTSRSTVAV